MTPEAHDKIARPDIPRFARQDDEDAKPGILRGAQQDHGREGGGARRDDEDALIRLTTPSGAEARPQGPPPGKRRRGAHPPGARHLRTSCRTGRT